MTDPWVWLGAGFILAALEALVPFYMFLGFGLGAFGMAALLWLAPGVIASGADGLYALLAIYAVQSLFAWLALWVVFRKRGAGDDVNDFTNRS